jgi:hypothetical protein
VRQLSVQMRKDNISTKVLSGSWDFIKKGR